MKKFLFAPLLALFIAIFNNPIAVQAQTPTCNNAPAQTQAALISGSLGGGGGAITLAIDGNINNLTQIQSSSMGRAYYPNIQYICGVQVYGNGSGIGSGTIFFQVDGVDKGSISKTTGNLLPANLNFSCVDGATITFYTTASTWNLRELQACTISATFTPTPSPTFTPQATYTPYPTYTPTFTPTATATGTLQPTYTPYPTGTPVPTYTPQPTPTPRYVCMDETWDITITNDITGGLHFSKTVVTTNTAKVTGAITLPLVSQGKMFTGTFATQGGFYQIDAHADAGQVLIGIVLVAQLCLGVFYVRNRYARGGKVA